MAVLVLSFGVISQAGYVLSGPYLVKGGELKIEQARPLSDVFIDNKRVGRINADGIGTFSGIRPGERNLIVAHSSAWPWTFNFSAESGALTTLKPLQVNQDAAGIPLLNTEDPVRVRAEKEFGKYQEPTRTEPLERQGTTVWVEGATVFVRNGEDVRSLYSASHPIRNIFWFGDRSDVIVIATQVNVFALDVRENLVQNFHPIYTGSAPEAVADPIRSHKIFVREGEQYLSVDI